MAATGMTTDIVPPSNVNFAMSDKADVARPHAHPTAVTGHSNLRHLSPAQRAALDDPQAQKVSTTWFEHQGRRLARSHVILDGLHCAACAGTIESAALQVPGVLDAKVNGASRRGEIAWDPERVQPSVWVAAIAACGYGAYPDTGTSRADLYQAETKKALWRLFVAGLCMMQVMMCAWPSYTAHPGELTHDIDQLLRWASWMFSVPVILFSSGPFFSGAWRALRQGKMGMDVPVALGILVTFIASSGATFDPHGVFGTEVYFDSLTMFVTFLLGGRYLEMRARNRTAQSLDAVLRRLPDSVERLEQGQWVRVNLEALTQGDVVRVVAGQAFPADGEVIVGRTQVDEALLTGESRAIPKVEGSAVVAGSINRDAPVDIRITALGPDTHYQQIVDLMQRASMDKPAIARAMDRIATPFLWGVLLIALCAAIVWQWIEPSKSIWVAVSILIVTCPCALSLSAPSALLAAAGHLARRGVLVQRLDALEGLASVNHVVFDKTGTLTHDQLQVIHIDTAHDAGITSVASTLSQEFLCDIAETLASRSHHPLSRSIVMSLKDRSQTLSAHDELHDVMEHPGQGVSGVDSQGHQWRLGSWNWVNQGRSLSDQPPANDFVTVWLSRDDEPQLRFVLEEKMRPDALQTVSALQAQGLNVEIVSGDSDARVQAAAQALGIEAARSQAMPDDKLNHVKRLQEAGKRVLVVGDGLNDAPVLASAQVSFAMAHGAALAQSKADFVMTGHQLINVPLTRHTSLKAMRIVRQNMIWSVLYNVICIPLAVMGWLPPWLAGLGMAVSSLLVILNGLRLNPPQRSESKPSDQAFLEKAL